MDADCKQGLMGFDIDVETRTGVPYCVSDLGKVAAGTARTVLLLNNNDPEVGLMGASRFANGHLGFDTWHLTLDT